MHFILNWNAGLFPSEYSISDFITRVSAFDQILLLSGTGWHPYLTFIPQHIKSIEYRVEIILLEKVHSYKTVNNQLIWEKLGLKAFIYDTDLA